MNKKLPDKLYKLLNIALNDAVLCSKDANYRMDMSVWHSRRGKLCSVCLAGSVMAKTLKTNRRQNKEPDDFCRDTEKKLTVIDEIRDNNLVMAYHKLVKKPKIETLKKLQNIEQSLYSYDLHDLRFYPLANMKQWRGISEKLRKLNV